MKRFGGMFLHAVKRWAAHKAGRRAGALAFYTIFSLAPALIIIIALASVILGEERARNQAVQQVNSFVGESAGGVTQTALENADPAGSGPAAITGVIFLILGATAVVAELHSSLNDIWGLKVQSGHAFWAVAKKRLLSFVVVVALGGLLVLATLLGEVLSAMRAGAEQLGGLPVEFWVALNYGILLIVIFLFFALINRILPDAKIAWKGVIVGSIVSTVLFAIGNVGLRIFMGYSDKASSYGAAASFVALLIWIYYSAMIFLLGAEFTCVYTYESGLDVRPQKNIEWRTPPWEQGNLDLKPA